MIVQVAGARAAILPSTLTSVLDYLPTSLRGMDGTGAVMVHSPPSAQTTAHTKPRRPLGRSMAREGVLFFFWRKVGLLGPTVSGFMLVEVQGRRVMFR